MLLLCLDCYGNAWHTLSFAILMAHLLHTAWFYCFSEKLTSSPNLRHPNKVYDDDDDDDQIIYSLSAAHSTFTCPLIHPFVCSFVLRSSFRSFVRWFIQSFILFKGVLFQELHLHFLSGHMIKSHVKMNKARAHIIRCVQNVALILLHVTPRGPVTWDIFLYVHFVLQN